MISSSRRIGPRIGMVLVLSALVACEADHASAPRSDAVADEGAGAATSRSTGPDTPTRAPSAFDVLMSGSVPIEHVSAPVPGPVVPEAPPSPEEPPFGGQPVRASSGSPEPSEPSEPSELPAMRETPWRSALPRAFSGALRSVEHGMCLSAPEDASGSPLRLDDCEESVGGRIRFVPVADKIDVFELHFVHDGSCAVVDEDVPDLSAGGVTLVKGPCRRRNLPILAQFRLHRFGDGRYAIALEHSAKHLDVLARWNAERTERLRIPNQRDARDSDTQRWELVDVEGEVPAAASPAIAGRWGDVIDWPHIPVSAANLPDGRLVTWAARAEASYRSEDDTRTYSSVYDPAIGHFSATDNYAGHDMFCSGISLLEDGTVHASGGNPARVETSLFRPGTQAWERTGDMLYPRWYGTTTLLPDGDVFATHARGAGTQSELYSSASGIWSRTRGASMATLETEQIQANAVEDHGPSVNSQWYAFMHVAPNGRVFHAGPTPTMHWFDTRYEGRVEEAGTRAGDERIRMFGSSVMYDSGKLLVTGGNDRRLSPSSSDAAFTIDISGTVPEVTVSTPMSYPRVFHNAVVLPDGQVLVVGGNSSGRLFSDRGTRLTPELWNPDTDTWRNLGDMDVPRNYHSVALLMPDGRVFSGGGGLCGEGCLANHSDAQIFSPPYLFDANGEEATRPSISGAPASASPGETISVRSTDRIAAFSLIRLAGTTHGINTDQRHLRPDVTPDGDGGYELRLEENPNVLVPGNYWLFALDVHGVPSLAHVINVRNVTGDGIDGSFAARLKSVSSEKCLSLPDVAGGADGTLRQQTCDDRPAQTIDFVPAAGEPDVFALRFGHSGQCLDVLVGADDWVGNGSDLVQRPCETTAKDNSSQHFRVVSRGLGRYLIASVRYGKVLDLRHGSRADGAPVQFWESFEFDTQLWTFD